LQYCIGNIRVAFDGDSAASRILQDTLRPIGSDDASNPELRFQFVDRLPGIEGRRHARIKDVHIGDGHVRVHESLWHYDISRENDTLNVAVAPRPEGPLQCRLRDLKKSWRYLHTYGRGSYLHRVRAFCFSSYLPMVQLALLNHGSTFCHSSAIEREGQAILFPACGGVGKTSLMSRYVEQGWNFLADDLCTLDAQGRATIHPLPMHIYKYHESQAAGLVRKMLERSTPWDRRMWKLWGTIKKPDKMVRWVKPGQVFGEQRLSRGGQVAKVFHLHRSRDAGAFRHEELDPSEVAARIASNLLEESSSPSPQVFGAAGSCLRLDFVPELGTMYDQIRQTCTAGLANAACYSIAIPQQANATDITRYLHQQGLMQAVESRSRTGLQP
jgi:hypothetical protein